MKEAVKQHNLLREMLESNRGQAMRDGRGREEI